MAYLEKLTASRIL